VIKKIVRVFDDFFKIDKAFLQYEKFDGTLTPELLRLNFNRGDSVAVLLYDPSIKAVVLTRQFRFPAYYSDAQKGWQLEIVAGLLETNECPEAAAHREVFEEVGFQVPRLEFVTEFFLSPGGSSEKIRLYFAEAAASDQTGTGGGVIREGEDICVESIPLARALEMIRTNEIGDAKTIIALLWLDKKLMLPEKI
jgi:ADP-ribose pyrophosphatase